MVAEFNFTGNPAAHFFELRIHAIVGVCHCLRLVNELFGISDIRVCFRLRKEFSESRFAAEPWCEFAGKAHQCSVKIAKRLTGKLAKSILHAHFWTAIVVE